MLTLSFIFVLHGDSSSGLIGFFVRYHIHFMIVLGLVGIVLGGLSYYGFTSQQKDVRKSQNFSKEIIFKFLDETEKTIISYLVEKQEPVTQSTISRIKDIGKVKSFRTLQRLENKGLIKIEPHGKTNRIMLEADIQKLFSSSKSQTN